MKTHNDISGFCLIHKESGITSHDVIRQLKRKIPKKNKIGHSGTLDPFATGLLVIALGEATKFIPYLNESFKIYKATIKLGVATDTLDLTGEVVTQKDVVDLSEKKVNEVLFSFLGETMQEPPMFSARKVDGKRLYQVARKGIEVERKPTPITIKNIELLKIDGDELTFIVSCSKGTYIRQLGVDIALKLKTVGHLVQLERLSSGGFDIKDACLIDDWNNDKIFPITQALSHLPLIYIDDEEKIKIRNGMTIPIKSNFFGHGMILDQNDLFLGVGDVLDHGYLKPKRLISL